MKKLFLFCFLLLFYGICAAQTSGRIKITGEIIVPPGFEAAGITIYNQNANRGAVSGEKGEFSIPVKDGDSLLFSAIQFAQLLLVVNREIIESGKLVVQISEGVNELPEIVIRPHNLSGVISEDVKKIDVVEINSSAINYDAVKNLNFAPDSQTVPVNAALGQTMAPASVDLLPILEFVVGLFPKRSKAKEEEVSYDFVDRELRNRYSEEFFETTFSLKSEEINDFIYFAEENGLDGVLLRKEKEMDLLQFLLNQSRDYHKQKSLAD